MTEEWRPVVGFGAGYYEVSATGAVRRIKAGPGTQAGRVLRPSTHRNGYSLYTLNVNGEQHPTSAHRLVADAFLGERPLGAEVVRHLDGNPQNNDCRNLRWGSWQDNADDRIRHGNNFNGNSLLTECKRGHSLLSGDVRHTVNSRGEKCRVCRECIRITRRARDAQKRAANALR